MNDQFRAHFGITLDHLRTLAELWKDHDPADFPRPTNYPPYLPALPDFVEHFAEMFEPPDPDLQNTRPIYQLTYEDVLAVARDHDIEIPPDKLLDCLRAVRNALDYALEWREICLSALESVLGTDAGADPGDTAYLRALTPDLRRLVERQCRLCPCWSDKLGCTEDTAPDTDPQPDCLVIDRYVPEPK